MSVPAAYIAIVVIWSTTPLAIVWSSESFGPMPAAGLRLILSLAILLVLRPLLGSPAMAFKRFWKAYVAASLGIFPALALVYWSADYLPSSLISVLYGLCPFAVVGLNYFFVRAERIGLLQFGSIVLSFAGLSIVLWSGVSTKAVSVIGVALILGAVLFAAVSSILVKAYSKDVNLINQVTGALMFSTPLFLLPWVLGGADIPETYTQKSVYAIVYLAVAGSVLGFLFFYYLLQRISVAAATLIPLITPVFSVVLGVWLNAEQISTYVYMGIVCILAGLWIFHWQDRRRRAEADLQVGTI